MVASWATVALLVPATLYGLLAEQPYRGASAALALGSRAQDVLTLVLLPVLSTAGYRSRSGVLRAHLLWLGLLSYLGYSYAIYLIGSQQNQAFLLYAAVVTITTAALVDGLVRIDPVRLAPAFAGLGGRGRRGAEWLLVTVGAVFGALWLVDLLPVLTGTGRRATSGPAGSRSPSTCWTWQWRCPRSSRPV